MKGLQDIPITDARFSASIIIACLMKREDQWVKSDTGIEQTRKYTDARRVSHVDIWQVSFSPCSHEV